MIIDSHVHVGKSEWGNFSPEKLLEILGDDIDFAICSHLEGIDNTFFKNEKACNTVMLETSKKYPKFKPLYVCQPNISANTEVAKSFLENHSEFVGLKLHPEYMRLPADSELYDKYLKLAQDFKKPCLYHSGHIKSRFSSPKLIYKKAQEFPDVPIILGHLSTGPKQSHIDAVEILLESIEKENSLLYVDVSWIDFGFETLNESYEDTIMLIEKLRTTSKGDYTHRILWGTDAMVGKFNHTRDSYQKNLSIFKQRIAEHFNDAALLENLLANNARNLYKF